MKSEYFSTALKCLREKKMRKNILNKCQVSYSQRKLLSFTLTDDAQTAEISRHIRESSFPISSLSRPECNAVIRNHTVESGFPHCLTILLYRNKTQTAKIINSLKQITSKTSGSIIKPYRYMSFSLLSVCTWG